MLLSDVLKPIRREDDSVVDVLPKPRALAHTISEINGLNEAGGEALYDLKELLKERANTLGKAKGSITIKIEMENQAGDEHFRVSFEVSSKAPKARSKATLLYDGHDGSLTQINPNQRVLPFSDVSSKATGYRDVAEG